MTSPVWLIAEREFRTYVVTLSFWAALAVGPLAAGGGLLLVESTHQPAQPVVVRIASHDSALARATESALNEAGSLDGRHFAFGKSGARVTVGTYTPNRVELGFAPEFPLSASGRALVARTLERDAARHASNAAPLTVHQITPSEVPRRRNAAAVAHLLLMMMLWLTLTGSLGMLLQTVVRERATRSLESLLAAVAPWQIMAGKLIGVGGVSLLVLAAWLGSSTALALFVPGASLAPGVFSVLGSPGLLARTVLIYILAYSFYGSVTVALGAMARDSASAQNLARPMFILLVAAFFVALASALGGAQSLAWLVYIPAFTPFLLLLASANTIPVEMQVALLTLLGLSASLAAGFAVSRFTLRESGASLLVKAG